MLRRAVNAAVRYDHYDTYGGQATPKAGFKFTPVQIVSIRGTCGKGFRAPSISESAVSGIAFGEGNGADPVLCANGANAKGSYNALCSYPVVGVEPPNPKLKAVTSTRSTCQPTVGVPRIDTAPSIRTARSAGSSCSA
jgi:iron complex outermembrane recepter protein